LAAVAIFQLLWQWSSSWEWEGKSHRIFVRHLGDGCRDWEEIWEKPAECPGSVADLAVLSLFPLSQPALISFSPGMAPQVLGVSSLFPKPTTVSFPPYSCLPLSTQPCPEINFLVALL